MPGLEIEIVVKDAGLILEARLDLPDAPKNASGATDTDNPRLYPGVVLCHPHPLYGGDMDNNVIRAVARELNGRGIAALRFNFRGVGKSRGSFAGGSGEQNDAESAVLALAGRAEIDPHRIGIAGYSFGGMVTLAVGERSGPVKAIAAVSPVIPPGVLRDCPKPKLIVCGAEDELTPSTAVLREAAGMAEPKTVLVIPGADHFWWGREEKAADPVANFFSECL
ncbi:MAG: alpha/beta family hydrolase [Bacillota bacterium]